MRVLWVKKAQKAHKNLIPVEILFLIKKLKIAVKNKTI